MVATEQFGIRWDNAASPLGHSRLPPYVRELNRELGPDKVSAPVSSILLDLDEDRQHERPPAAAAPSVGSVPVT